jgi:hypothetical protein
MIKQKIIQELNVSKANIIPYYFDNTKIPKSIQKYLNMSPIRIENYYNITFEIFDIKKQKSNGLLFGICSEIGEKLKILNINYNYIFSAPSLCSIIIALFRFTNSKIIIFPYLSLTKIKYNYNQLLYITKQLKKIFNLTNIEIDLSFMEDYIDDENNIYRFNNKYNFMNIYMYLYNVIKNKYNCNVLCIIEELYNDNNTNIYLCKQKRDNHMNLCNIDDTNIIINLINKYNLPIIHQIIENTNV